MGLTIISSSPELFVTDMDGTLTDTQLVVIALGKACLAEGISIEPLTKLVDSYALLEISYNAWSYVEKYGPDMAEAIKERFLEYCFENPIVYDDALDYLDFLEQASITNIIMTTGNQTWQTIKLEAAGLNQIPHQIIQDDSKGNVIRSWRNTSGRLFIVPREILRISTSNVSIADDKLSSLKGLPEDCNGYLVVRDDNKISGALQTSNLPPNIHVVRSLLDITEDIDRRYL